MKNKTDVIVVGGGPGGISAAITVARAGKNVILIERGSFSGSKNAFGGAIYAQPTREVFPNFEESAPLERKIVNHKYLICTEEDSVAVSYRVKDDDNAFSVIRGKFDKWMALEAEKAGVVLVTETLVNELILKEDKVVGVKTELEEYYANIVIVADGVNSLLAKQIGLREEILPKDVALGVKEVLKLSEEKINERFNLEQNQGAVFEIVGGPMLEMLGLGYLYTNKDSVSIGIGIGLDELSEKKLKPYEVLDQLKEHPAIKNLLKDGELIEYSAHLIPEGGYKKLPKLYSDGAMLVGDSAMLVNNVHWEGTNLAMISGKMAGEVAIYALNKNDFSKNTLALYQQKLENSFIIKDLKSYKNIMDIAHSREKSYLGFYPKIMTEFFKTFTTVDSIPKREKFRKFIKNFFTQRSISELFKDFIGFLKIGTGILK